MELTDDEIVEKIEYIRSLDIKKLPAFYFYPGAWLGHSVTRLTYEAQGVFIRLLSLMWKTGVDQVTLKWVKTELARSLGLSTRKFGFIVEGLTEKDGGNLRTVIVDSVEYLTSVKMIEVRIESATYQLKQQHASRSRPKKTTSTGTSTGTSTEPSTDDPGNIHSLTSSVSTKEHKEGQSPSKPKNTGQEVSKKKFDTGYRKCRELLKRLGYWNETTRCQKRLLDYLNSLAKEAKGKGGNPDAYFTSVASIRLSERMDDFRPDRTEILESEGMA